MTPSVDEINRPSAVSSLPSKQTRHPKTLTSDNRHSLLAIISFPVFSLGWTESASHPTAIFSSHLVNIDGQRGTVGKAITPGRTDVLVPRLAAGGDQPDLPCRRHCHALKKARRSQEMPQMLLLRWTRGRDAVDKEEEKLNSIYWTAKCHVTLNP